MTAALPYFDVWICQGRLCTSGGADDLYSIAEQRLGELNSGRVRLLRGGCYGHCELGPNLVVRRYPAYEELPDPEVDRLSLTFLPNEFLYSRVEVSDIAPILRSHLLSDRSCIGKRFVDVAQALPPNARVLERLRRPRSLNLL